MVVSDNGTEPTSNAMPKYPFRIDTQKRWYLRPLRFPLDIARHRATDVSTCNAISVPTCFSVFIWKWV